MEMWLLVIYTFEWEFHTFVNIEDARMFEADYRKLGKIKRPAYIYRKEETIYA